MIPLLLLHLPASLSQLPLIPISQLLLNPLSLLREGFHLLELLILPDVPFIWLLFDVLDVLLGFVFQQVVLLQQTMDLVVELLGQDVHVEMLVQQVLLLKGCFFFWLLVG